MNPQKDELNPPYDPKPKTLAEAIAANETDPFFKELVEETDKIIDAHNMAAKTAKIAEQTFTPALGGGKERSVTYQTKLCRTAGEIDEFLNQDAYAYSYIYWNTQAKGVFITLCKPNPKSHIQKYQPRIERGLLEISESDAIPKIKALFPVDDLDLLPFQQILTRLYDEGFRLCEQVDRKK